MYLLKTLVFFLDSREGPKLTVNFKAGWQQVDRLREGRLASSRQTGRKKADRQKDANRGQWGDRLTGGTRASRMKTQDGGRQTAYKGRERK
jgi:hypothetical protein